MSMDPLKRLISFAGVMLLLMLLYSVFSGFFTDVTLNQQFPVQQPNHRVLFVAPIQTQSLEQVQVTGTLYDISYQKGRVFYIENLSLRANMEVQAYLSLQSTYRDGPLVGSLLASRGNVTIYVPSDIVANSKQTYPYVLFWSPQTKQVIAYANLTN